MSNIGVLNINTEMLHIRPGQVVHNSGSGMKSFLGGLQICRRIDVISLFEGPRFLSITSTTSSFDAIQYLTKLFIGNSNTNNIYLLM